MLKKKYKNIIFTAIALAIALIMAFSFYTSEKQSYASYKNLQQGLNDGYTVLASASQIEGEDYSVGKKSRWRLDIELFGKKYTAVSTGEYSQSFMEKAYFKIEVIYYLENNSPATHNIEITPADRAKGISGYLICMEADYFLTKEQPQFTATTVLGFALGGIVLILIINCAILFWYKSLEKNGFFTYALFVEAIPSALGSTRKLKIRYRYKVDDQFCVGADDDGWREAVSPAAYTPLDVEKLKSIDAMGIRYNKRHSMITENLKYL